MFCAIANTIYIIDVYRCVLPVYTYIGLLQSVYPSVWGWTSPGLATTNNTQTTNNHTNTTDNDNTNDNNTTIRYRGVSRDPDSGCTWCAQTAMRARRLPLRVVPLRENVSWPVQGKVSQRLWQTLRGFTLLFRALKCQPTLSDSIWAW